MKRFTDQQVPDQSGKTFLITGGNAGIGFETATVLAQHNARVIIGCRNLDKANTAIERILKSAPNANIDPVSLDLGDLESVQTAAQTLQREPRLDVLINNAGIMTPPLEHTAQGFESQFGINHLGPFLLTQLLLDKLESTPNARIVNTSSLAHRSGHIRFDDIHAERRYSSTECYSQSKLANLLFAFELQRRLAAAHHSTVAVACHPGIADTELSRHLPSYFKYITPLVRLVFNTPRQGAWPTLMAATDPDIRGGDYCGPSRFGQTSGPATRVKPHQKTQNLNLATRLWRLSETLSGVDFLAPQAAEAR